MSCLGWSSADFTGHSGRGRRNRLASLGRALHEGWVYSRCRTLFVQCAQPCVDPHPRGVDRTRRGTCPKPASDMHCQQPEEGPRMSGIATKGPDRSRGDEANRMISLFRSRDLEFEHPLSPIWTPTGRFPSPVQHPALTLCVRTDFIFQKTIYPTPATRLTKITPTALVKPSGCLCE